MSLPKTPLIPADGTIQIVDGTAGTPLAFTLAYEDGDLQISGIKPGYKETQVFETRGNHYSVRKTKHKPIAFSFTAHATGFIDAADVSIPAALLALAGTTWAAALSTIPTGQGDAELRSLKWTGERTNLGGTTDAGLTLKYSDCEFDFSEGIPGKFSIKGEAYILASDAVAWT